MAMLSRSRNLFLLAIGILAASIACVSCGGDDDVPGGDMMSPECPQVEISAANAALEAELFEHLQQDAPDVEEPDDVDFRTANQLFENAFESDPGCLDARFGVAITDLLILSTDAEVNAAFDEWDAYLEDRVPFETDDGPGRPLGIPIAPARGTDALRLPFDVLPMTLLAMTRPDPASAFPQADPQLDRIQEILEERVLPPLRSAVSHLEVVGDSADYTYTVTGRMQGDDEEESAEIDQTDIVALRAAARVLIAAIDVTLAYEVNIAEYDSASLLAAISPGSSFGTLRDGAENRLDEAYALLQLAVDDVDQATELLGDETDNQDDDIIKIGPDDVSQADLDSIRANIPNVRAALTTGYTRIDDWDDDDATPSVPLTIRIAPFFQQPIQDLKALAPAYTPRIEQRAFETDYDDSQGQEFVQISANEQRQYYGSAGIFLDDGEEREYFNGDEELRDALLAVVRSRLDEARQNPRLIGFSGSAYFSGTLLVGLNMIGVNWYDYVETGTRYVFVPVIDWTAETFEAWEWPDPTFNGTLPDIGSTEELFQTFGIDEDDWDEELILDWSDLGKRRMSLPGERVRR